MLRLLLVALLALAPVAAGCGGDDDEGGATSQPTQAAPPASTPGTGATAPIAPGPQTPTVEQIRASLLTEDDVGDGWEGGPVADDENATSLCGLGRLDAGAVADADVRFVNGDLQAIVGHGVNAYRAGSAQQVMSEAATAFADCEQETEDGRARIRLSALPAPDLGDEALAFRLESEEEGVVDAGELLLVRRGGLVALLLYIGDTPEVDRALVDRLAGTVDQRLTTLAGG